ncbi:MAG: hypothetical protein CMG74_02860 [Candidatus Marinimicrobia bacterium]|nr:hypothetical protein [Candidatus Neomarinimicrobiota bacterium]|tara:strand:+ start:699 stop:1595 length:897 start_codon:yes stop_codon:yes gene_type:complete
MKEPYLREKLLHIPVLGTEVLSLLKISPKGVYFDGTIGTGGHASMISKKLSNQGLYIGVDRDEKALSHCKQRFSSSAISISFHHSSYHKINSIIKPIGLQEVNGFLLDLGYSSMQLDSHQRGFSYQNDSPLDMRFDQSQKETAANILNTISSDKLANIIYKFGEERRSRSIAKNIAKYRPLNSVDDLVEVIRKVTPPNHRNRTLARVFQAIRIKVNNELEYLNAFLNNFINYLTIGGRIAIISFHSLEDRIVKHRFKNLKQNGRLKILTQKPITASDKEILNNRRSKSAKLRVAEKIS